MDWLIHYPIYPKPQLTISPSLLESIADAAYTSKSSSEFSSYSTITPDKKSAAIRIPIPLGPIRPAECTDPDDYIRFANVMLERPFARYTADENYLSAARKLTRAAALLYNNGDISRAKEIYIRAHLTIARTSREACDKAMLDMLDLIKSHLNETSDDSPFMIPSR